MHWTVVTGSGGEPLLSCQLIDLTEQHRVEELLAHRATHDPLTELGTRTVFLSHLERALHRLPRTDGQQAVVLFLDLDRLKYVNDTFGHLTGDAVLAEFSTRLRAAVRPSDVVARLGGDEFAVLLEEVDHPAESVVVAERILAAMRSPFVHSGRRIEICASIGIAVSATSQTTPDVLVAHADAAMYRAKQRGRGRFELFDDDAYTATVRRQSLEQELRSAVDRGQLLLHYQPIRDLNAGSIHAVEALLRWQHPERGLVSAAEFIHVAEDSDLLPLMARWLFETACCQLAGWDAELGADAPEAMFVNVAGSQLSDAGLVEAIADAVSGAGIAADRLFLEITESQIIADPLATAVNVAALQDMGCSLVVDDFGTGYSSLSRLSELPISVLKIDRSFVHAMINNRRTAAIAASVALLAHNLGHTVIAEGVETREELVAVTELGCELAQGFYIAPPLGPSAVADFVRATAGHDRGDRVPQEIRLPDDTADRQSSPARLRDGRR
jgi:diguanylate cyclase (GGDEF)-like protein